MIAEGWSPQRKNERTARITRAKSHAVLLEDRVWTLLYKMQFSYLSGEGGARLPIDPRAQVTPTNQLDAVAIDSEIALAIECKSSLSGGKRTQFQEELGKLTLARRPFINAVNKAYPQQSKRHVGIVFAYTGFYLSDNDKERAAANGVLLLEEKDIEYYESLVHHIGPAARYQFLADLFPGKTIEGLQIKVPAIRSKIGKRSCYTFSITPEYLLKLSFVSHRAKGKASDVDTYQRLLIKSRLKKIREYITADGVFPTNIVVNFEPNRLEFSPMEQDPAATGGGIAGWLKIRPAYKSAWIIDGQHRLFAYSGHRGRPPVFYPFSRLTVWKLLSKRSFSSISMLSKRRCSPHYWSNSSLSFIGIQTIRASSSGLSFLKPCKKCQKTQSHLSSTVFSLRTMKAQTLVASP